MDRQHYMKSYRAAYKNRARVVKVTLDNDLYAALSKAAKHDGTTPTGFVRVLVAGSLSGDQQIPVAVASELRALERLIRNIANNLNQLAHHANTVRRVVDIDAVFAELRRLDAAVRDHTLKRLTWTDDHQSHDA